MQIPRLREWRERRALTQEELGTKAGISVRSVAGYEAGAGARPGTVRQLAAALDIPVEELTSNPKGRAPSSPEQQSFNGLLEEARRSTTGDIGWPDERFRSAVSDATYDQLKELIGALVGNRPAPVLEDFGLDRDAAMRKGAARAQIYAFALDVRRELLDRGEQDPREYLQDLDAYLEALDFD